MRYVDSYVGRDGMALPHFTMDVGRFYVGGLTQLQGSLSTWFNQDIFVKACL